jgi:hypothetical protein
MLIRGRPGTGRRRARGQDARAVAAWVFAYRRPLRRRAARLGPFRAAPVATGFLTVCLLVSLVWHLPGSGHRLVTACCAYRAWRPSPGDAARLVAGAFLLRAWYEVVWTVAATVLVTGPFEAWMGSSGRVLTTIALGQVVPTIAVAYLPGHRLGDGGLDVGSSAVIAAAAAGLAVRSRSLPVAGCLVIAQLVAALTQSPLATVEHVAAILVGALATIALSRPRRRRSG